MGTKSDLWAIGIMMFTFIMNKLPFADNLEEAALINRIAKFEDSPDKHPQLPPNNIISNSLTNLVNELLIVDPAKRISLDDFLDRLESCNTIDEDSQKMERQQKCARWLRSLKNDVNFQNQKLKQQLRALTLANEREKTEKEKLKR